jgi:pSer/pThr/pTyr-binding forkhead associated (FHA) protein
MYLEVHIESTDPQLFIIDQDEILVGALESNEIVVTVSSVSKKHVKIIKEEKRWYALDLGSTNGTYIDTERLVPGNRKEIFINQYLRLGDVVHIVLLKTPHNSNPVPKVVPKPPPIPKSLENREKTRVVALKDLNEAKSVPKSREENREEPQSSSRSKLSKKEKKSFTRTLIISLIILIAGFFLQRHFAPKEMKSNLIEKANEVNQRSVKEADKILE